MAAKFAYPDRPVFALAGDGAIQTNGMNELITVSKYWKEWKDPRFYVLVLNNPRKNCTVAFGRSRSPPWLAPSPLRPLRGAEQSECVPILVPNVRPPRW